MKLYATTAGVLALVVLSTASCNRSAEQPPTHDTPAPAVAATQPLDITFRTEPDPPKSGETSIDVTVRGANGQPVTDAEVSAQFYMAPMTEMKMPEMRNAIPLSHDGGGRYKGKGNIMMAGKWDVTVSVRRGAEEIGKRTVSVTAQ